MVLFGYKRYSWMERGTVRVSVVLPENATEYTGLELKWTQSALGPH